MRDVGTDPREGRRRNPAEPDPLRRHLLAGRRSLDVTGDLAAARRSFAAAAAESEARHDAASLGEASLGLGGLWLYEHRGAVDAARVRAWRERALRDLDPATDLALRLRVRDAAEADYPRGATGRILPALEEARRRGDPAILAEALRHALHVLLGPRHAALRLALADELVSVAAAAGRPAGETLALMWRAIVLFLAGDPHAERALAAARGHPDARRHLAIRYVFSAIDVMLSIRAGKLSEAEVLAAGCAERGVAAGDPDVAAWKAAHLGTIRWFQGRAGELVPALRDLASSPALSEPDDSILAGLAAAAATAGDAWEATAAIQRLRRADLGRLPESSVWLVSLYAVVQAAHVLGDAATSAEAYDLLLPFAHLPVMASFAVTCLGSVEHPLGVASMTVGEHDRAVEHLRRALVRDAALGHRPAHLMARAALVGALVRRGGLGDAEEAGALADGVEREAPGLGMDGWLPRWRLRPGAWAAGVAAATCVRDGRGWRLTVGGRSVSVADSVGMRCLAELIANPGREIAALDLVRLEAPTRAPGGDPAAAGPELLDDAARAAYRARLLDLGAELEAAEADADIERGSRLRAEYDWLLTELEHATGLGGRSRRFASDNERARTAVQKAIRRAMTAIGREDERLRRDLEASVVTGSRCSFRPSADAG